MTQKKQSFGISSITNLQEIEKHPFSTPYEMLDYFKDLLLEFTPGMNWRPRIIHY